MAQLLILFLISTYIVSLLWTIRLVCERTIHIKTIKQLKRDVAYLKQKIITN